VTEELRRATQALRNLTGTAFAPAFTQQMQKNFAHGDMFFPNPG